MCTLGIRQACVIHKLLISYERYANAGRTQLYMYVVISQSEIRYKKATLTVDIRSVR